MVSVGVSKLGRTHLIFVQPGVKINGAYYRDVLLMQELLPVIRNISGDNGGQDLIHINYYALNV